MRNTLLMLVLLVFVSTYAAAQSGSDAPTIEQVEEALAAEKAKQANAARQAEINRQAQIKRFERVSEGIKDNEQNFIWAERDNGSDINWMNATQYCSGLGSGWTLPSSTALLSMYDASGKYPAPYVYSGTTFTVKPATPLIKFAGGWYWTNEQNGASEAWFVDLDNGNRESGPVDDPYGGRALCVRRS